MWFTQGKIQPLHSGCADIYKWPNVEILIAQFLTEPLPPQASSSLLSLPDLPYADVAEWANSQIHTPNSIESLPRRE